jgi:hypothetical protein
MPGFYKAFLTDHTMMRNIPGAITFFAVLFTFPGCSSFDAALRSLLNGPDVPAVEDIDYSYPVAGAAAQGGAIVFVFKPGFWEKLFHNPKPPVPANESEVIVHLGFLSEFQWILSWGVPPKRLSRIEIIWGEVKKILWPMRYTF